MATGSANSRRQTITATAPFSPRKPGNKACQNGAKVTNALCIHWVFLQSVPFTRERSQVQSLQRPPFFNDLSAVAGNTRQNITQTRALDPWRIRGLCSADVHARKKLPH
jgi:hypothetical protein